MKLATMNGDKVRIFTSGNSQAIRLPKKFRLSGQTARIVRKGKSLVITPEEDVWARFERGVVGLAGLWEGFERNQPAVPDHRGDIFP
ncbi:MAG: AbrB/MazE/SpoVT family DNA-binding domain-containing protein [Verrucomicrobiaceae bacterium]|nr:MAG: AbrB/MazE/SpoVT family DNA-binding domain-containing protein [Verrucomicrobiaceae bacterium]